MLTTFAAVYMQACVACVSPQPAAAVIVPPSALEAAPQVQLVHHRRNRWTPTRAAWRACRRRWGSRLVAAYENFRQYRCVYR